MSFDSDPKSPFDLALRPVGSSGTETGVRAFVLLPGLDALLGAPAFGHQSPIALPGSQRPADGWAQLGPRAWFHAALGPKKAPSRPENRG